MIKAEILAPAGNIESLKAAVQYGADAVYFGLSEFNARMKADNFTVENLSEWVDFCHLYGTKVYITLNTLIKNHEINKLSELVYKAATFNVDAFIVADIATVSVCKEVCPNIPLHFSTQFGIHNLEGAKNAVELGAKRIILARETPLSEIKRISNSLDVEIEAFVHGAMCVSFSGNCYLSSFIDGNSGNRGRCKQPCRLKYLSSINNKEEYHLSMKDLCLIERLQDLKNAGVVSFKIEGRLKSPEYVAASVVAYRKALLGTLQKSDMENLASSYSRISTEKGYLYSKKHNLITSKLQNNAGLIIGKVEKIEKLRNGLNKIYFKSSKKLNKGDGIKILIDGKEICGAELSSSVLERGYYVLYLSKSPALGADVALTQNASLLSILKKKEIEVDFALNEVGDGEYDLIISDGCYTANQKIKLFELSSSEKISQIDGIRRVLTKGSQPFVVKNVSIRLLSDNFLPHSILNSARKKCLELLIDCRISACKAKNSCKKLFVETKENSAVDSRRSLAFIVSSVEQLTDKLLSVADSVIYEPYDYNNIELEEVLNRVCKSTDVYFGLPQIAFYKDLNVLYKTIEKYNTCLSGVYGNARFGEEIAKKFSLPFFAGYGLNITNSTASSLYQNKVLSLELNKKEILEFPADALVYTYGKPELMYFSHCPTYSADKNCSNCAFVNGDVSYSNKNEEYIIKRIRVDECYFAMYPQEPICLFEYIDCIKNNVLIDLRNCDSVDFVIEAYNQKENTKNSVSGHFNKGVL